MIVGLFVYREIFHIVLLNFHFRFNATHTIFKYFVHTPETDIVLWQINSWEKCFKWIWIEEYYFRCYFLFYSPNQCLLIRKWAQMIHMYILVVLDTSRRLEFSCDLFVVLFFLYNFHYAYTNEHIYKHTWLTLDSFRIYQYNQTSEMAHFSYTYIYFLYYRMLCYKCFQLHVKKAFIFPFNCLNLLVELGLSA